MYYALYQLLSWLFFIAFFPFYLLYCACTGRYWTGWGQRFGFVEAGCLQDKPQRLWLHASSVGEVQVARALIRVLARRLPRASFTLSTMTEQGYEAASKQLPTGVRLIRAPFDLAGIVERVLRAVDPVVYICLETELWPNILRQAHRRGTKLVLLNGRLSARSYRRYRFFGRFMAELLSKFSAAAVINSEDAGRYIALGLDPDKVFVLGNAKYDLSAVDAAGDKGSDCRQRLGLAEKQPVLVAGSTHSGEEEMLLEVYNDLRSRDARLANLVWIVAPRHLSRLPEVAGLLTEKGIKFDRLSETAGPGRQADVILVDAVGDLAGLYSVADFVFCGGSLVDRGGHNIMEAAVHGRPVFYGPSMKDFADAAQLLEAVGAGFRITQPREMTEAVLYFLDHDKDYAEAGVRARDVALAQQGSAEKQAQLVVDLIKDRH